MDFVERRITQAQRKGFFDDLRLQGQPLQDLDQERPEGWWADTYVTRDKALAALRGVVASLPRLKSQVFLNDTHVAVRQGLEALNTKLTEANEAVEPEDRVEGIDIEDELARWRARERQKKWGRYLDT